MCDVGVFIIAGAMAGILVGHWLTQRRRQSGTVKVHQFDGSEASHD